MKNGSSISPLIEQTVPQSWGVCPVLSHCFIWVEMGAIHCHSTCLLSNLLPLTMHLLCVVFNLVCSDWAPVLTPTLTTEAHKNLHEVVAWIESRVERHLIGRRKFLRWVHCTNLQVMMNAAFSAVRNARASVAPFFSELLARGEYRGVALEAGYGYDTYQQQVTYTPWCLCISSCLLKKQEMAFEDNWNNRVLETMVTSWQEMHARGATHDDIRFEKWSGRNNCHIAERSRAVVAAFQASFPEHIRQM